MSTIKIYQVDAFTSKVFGGNPAAVCPLKEWISDELMQKMAAENNLSETAFYVPQDEGYHIRWFTPTVEVELCGHATLATAHVLFNHEGYLKDEIVFYCKIGKLKVRKNSNLIVLDFPSTQMRTADIGEDLVKALGRTPLEYYSVGAFGMAVFSSEMEISKLSPDFRLLKEVNESIVIVTAKGNEVDFVSRVFGPKVGIDEDPVTGAAHTRLIPYWAKVLGKKRMTAIQLSQRKGHLTCEDNGERVFISGEAVTYLIGEVYY